MCVFISLGHGIDVVWQFSPYTTLGKPVKKLKIYMVQYKQNCSSNNIIVQTADMHQLNKKDQRYSEIQIEGVKLFPKGITRGEIKGDDVGM